jgi:hypothetical protein
MADKANKYEILAHRTTFVAGAGIAFDRAQPNGSAHVGKFVMLSAEDTVDLVTTGSEVLGKLTKVEPDGFCSVQDRGYADGPSTGTITYTGANSGVVGGATAGSVAIAAGVPAAGAIRRARVVKGDGANRVIVDLG